MEEKVLTRESARGDGLDSFAVEISESHKAHCSLLKKEAEAFRASRLLLKSASLSDREKRASWREVDSRGAQKTVFPTFFVFLISLPLPYFFLSYSYLLFFFVVLQGAARNQRRAVS